MSDIESIEEMPEKSGTKKMLTMEDIYGDEDGDDYGSESEQSVIQEDDRVLLTKKQVKS
jgi:hypothetical protein